MQNSSTFGRSRSFTSVRFHPSVIGPDIATVTSGPSRWWRRLATLGVVSLVFLAGCEGGSKSVSNQPPPPTPPTPTITTISPNSAVAGGAAFTLTINGTNFGAGSMVNFGGSAPATTLISFTQLTAAIPATGIASTGTIAVTVTNPAPGGGTSSAMNFTITSGAASLPTISFIDPSCAPAGEQFVDSIDNQMVVIGQNFVAGSVVLWNGSDRPTTFDENVALTAQISASDIAAAGTAEVTVFNPGPGGGSSSAATFTITTGAVDPQSIAVDPAGKFAYVASAGCNAQGYVSMYTINPSTGALASIGPPVPSQDEGTGSVVVAPSGKFAYVTNSGLFDTDGSVSIYAISGTTGALRSAGALSGNSPSFCCFNSVAVDPSGKFAYAANGGGGLTVISMYTINGTTGALTSQGTIAAGGFPISVTVDPSGKFVYVANQNSTFGLAGNVAMFTIDAKTGVLTSIGTIAAGTNPNSVVVDPTGKFAYVVNFSSNDVSMYTINTTTGALASIGTIAAGTNPDSLAVDPAGKFAYVTNFKSNDVSMYTINSTTGALMPIGSIAAGMSPTAVVVHPSGKFAYVTNSGSNDISMYSVDTTTGVLTLVGTTGT
jgi:DNA-binding beta-propeller fold protein YncE